MELGRSVTLFSKFFASKIEKDLLAICPPGKELELRYRGGESITVSQVLKIYRDSIILLGFFAKLRSKEIAVRVLSTGHSFDTEVLRTGTDKNMNALFYCSMPKEIIRAKNPPARFTIYPNGSAKLLLSTNRGEKSVTMPIYEFAEYGITLVNDSEIEVKIGTKLFQALVAVGSLNAQLCNLQVANIKIEQSPDGPKRLLFCVFSAEPRALSEMLSQAKGLVPKPKSKSK